MRTVKLVVIGPSGVGKTSLRSQYLSGQFTTGYRSTIGADFITKVLPHHSNPNESITLQIWDTAGQERFSSLSSAFFRGADAALLMFDVNDPDTLQGLRKWWAEFKEMAPLKDEEAAEFCCVVVGNKTDLVSEIKVSEMDALKFIDELVPPGDNDYAVYSPTNGSSSIEINRRGRHISLLSHSRSRSRSLLRGGGTISTVRSGFTTYHTPSSSIFDAFESARSSPIPPSRSPSPTSPTSSTRGNQIRKNSCSSTSSTPTITPSLISRSLFQPIAAIAQQQQQNVPTIAFPLPERRPKLFFTSARTGQGVAEVFGYIAQRVTRHWEYQEDAEARTLRLRDGTSDTIQLGQDREGRNGRLGSCC